jgi:hypothetical protein
MTISLSREELVSWASQSLAFYEIEVSRISSILLAQAYASEMHHVFSTFDLTHAIKVLEGLVTADSTGEAEQFRHPPLTGLYKKHFTSPRFLIKNLQNFLQSKLGKQHFYKVWDEAIKAGDSSMVNEKFIQHLVHHVTIDTIAIKSELKKMTGEWIVFHKHKGENFYLSIAFHEETNEQIHQKIVQACEFDNLPFRL